jgi:hypothetical protein
MKVPKIFRKIKIKIFEKKRRIRTLESGNQIWKSGIGNRESENFESGNKTTMPGKKHNQKKEDYRCYHTSNHNSNAKSTHLSNNNHEDSSVNNSVRSRSPLNPDHNKK